MRSRFRAALAAPAVAAAAAAVAVSLHADTTVASNARADDPDAAVRVRLHAVSGLQAGELHADQRLLPSARQRERPDAGGQPRADVRGPRPGDGDRLGAGEPDAREPREVPGHRQPARPRARHDRRPGARPRQAGQGDRLGRLRHPLHRGRPAADRAAVRLRPADVQHARDEVDPQERHHAVRPEHQPGRRRAHPRLVHEVRRDAVPGLVLSRALPEVLRARRQPRLVHVQPARDAQPRQRAVAQLVSAAGLQHAPDRGLSGADLPAAVQGPDEPEHPGRRSRAGSTSSATR